MSDTPKCGIEYFTELYILILKQGTKVGPCECNKKGIYINGKRKFNFSR